MILCTFYFSLRLFADLLTAARLPVGINDPRASAPEAQALLPISSTPLPLPATDALAAAGPTPECEQLQARTEMLISPWDLSPPWLPPATTTLDCGSSRHQVILQIGSTSDLRPAFYTVPVCWSVEVPAGLRVLLVEGRQLRDIFIQPSR